MSRVLSSLIATFLLTAAHGAAFAESPAETKSPAAQQVLPVLVKVSTQGKITDVRPASRLPTQMDRLLRANLEELLARDGKSKFTESDQFVANMALDAVPTTDGKQSVKFSLISSQPVPSGAWAWTRVDNRRLVLVNQDQRLDHSPQTIRAPVTSFSSVPSSSGGGGNTPPAGGKSHS